MNLHRDVLWGRTWLLNLGSAVLQTILTAALLLLQLHHVLLSLGRLSGKLKGNCLLPPFLETRLCECL